MKKIIFIAILILLSSPSLSWGQEKTETNKTLQEIAKEPKKDPSFQWQDYSKEHGVLIGGIVYNVKFKDGSTVYIHGETYAYKSEYKRINSSTAFFIIRTSKYSWKIKVKD